MAIWMSEFWGQYKAVVLMLVVQLVYAGVQILSRVILTQGAFVFALLAYRHVVASLCIAPFAFFFERGEWKKITRMVVLWLLLTSLTGITMGMGLLYYGLKQTNATFATNFLNLIPIATFTFSVILRMETLELGTRRGKVKLVGTLVCVGGAVTVSLYKGKTLISHHNHSLDRHISATMANPKLGMLLLIGSVLSLASWFIVQAKMLQAFPFRYWATLLACIFASIQSAIVGLCIDRGSHAWKLQWNLQLLTIVYSGGLASGLNFYLTAWTVANKGPTFVPMFNPLGLIFVVGAEIVLLGADLQLGSVLGMVGIVIGLYSFLWGRRSSNKTPTLPVQAGAQPRP